MYWHCMISLQLQKRITYLHSAFAISACFCYVYIGFQRSPLLCLTKNELTFQFIENHSCAKSNIKLVFDTYKSVRNRLFVYINDGSTLQVTRTKHDQKIDKRGSTTQGDQCTKHPKPIGHFRVPKALTFKMRLSAKPFL